MSSIKVMLGGAEYEVPKMNIGQLEEVTIAFDLPPARRPFAILKIAMKRAQPKLADINDLEPGNDEITVAIRDILANSGFKKEEKNPNHQAPDQKPGDVS